MAGAAVQVHDRGPDLRQGPSQRAAEGQRGEELALAFVGGGLEHGLQDFGMDGGFLHRGGPGFH